MPWERQFDEAEVLEKAMAAFWARGYEATSIRDLVDCMGLNRGSIYAAFGDKRRLFLKALAHYETCHRRAWFESLRRRHSPRAAILSVFEGAIGGALSDRDRSGCFLINTAVELSPHDAEIARAVAKGLRETEGFFRELVEEGQAAGEISPEADPARTARTLLGLLSGLRVLARSRPERPLLEALADQAADLLK
jgi:TetR/AcrR family transcriptional repressor of nem operon